MEVKFTTPKDIVIVPELKKTLESITITEIVDNAERKTVTARTNEVGQIILWSGPTYDTIGQWTDTDVQNRVNELYI